MRKEPKMSKLWILIKREYAQVVKKKSFVIGILLTPVFMVAITVLPALLASKESDYTEKIAIIDLDGQGLGQKMSEKISVYTLDDDRPAYEVTNIIEASNYDSARVSQLRLELDSLVQVKELKSYLILSKGILDNDSCFMVAKSFVFRTNNRFDNALTRILSGMRLEKSNINISTDSVLQLTHQTVFEHLAPGGKTRDFMTMYLAGIVFVMIIFGTIISFGQILMRSVIEEKNSRIVEVIASSVSPFQMMAGKIIGLGLASMTQVAAWMAMGTIVYGMRGSLNIPADISGILFNPVFMAFFVVFLVLGYILYSTFFALIGSIVNTDKETQSFIFPITMSLMLPILMAMYIIQEPDSPLVTGLSLFPLFTPTMMVLRMNIIGVDTFTFSNPIIMQATIGAILTFISIIIVTWITARIFRIGILMYGKRPTLPEIFKWIRYK